MPPFLLFADHPCPSRGSEDGDTVYDFKDWQKLESKTVASAAVLVTMVTVILVVVRKSSDMIGGVQIRRTQLRRCTY